MVIPTIRVVKIFLIGSVIILTLLVGVLISWNKNKANINPVIDIEINENIEKNVPTRKL